MNSEPIEVKYESNGAMKKTYPFRTEEIMPNGVIMLKVWTIGGEYSTSVMPVIKK